MLDGQLNTMYRYSICLKFLLLFPSVISTFIRSHTSSSGSPEAGSDNAETRGEFLDKLTKARNAVLPGSLLHSIFSVPDASKTVFVFI